MKLKLSLLTVMAVCLLATSCSKDESLLEAIPSEVENAGTVKLKSLLEQAGCEFTADGVNVKTDKPLPQRLSALTELAGAIDRSGAADLDRTAWVYTPEGELFLTAMVTDRDKLTAATAETIDWVDAKATPATGSWEQGALTVILEKNRLWMTTAKGENAAKAVIQLKDKAKKSPITALAGVTQSLEEDNLLNMAVRRSPITKAGNAKSAVKGESHELTTLWATLGCNVKDNRIEATSKMMEGDGKPSAPEGMRAIDNAVLAYVPGNFNVAFAMGLTPQFDWSILNDLVGTFGGFQARGMLAAATPYLAAIDGTVMLAAGPANDQAYSDIDPGNWNFILMARLPQGKINELMNTVRTTMFMAGMTPRESADGSMLIVPQYGMNLYIGNVDGYLGVSNMPFETNRQNSLAPQFGGKDGAVRIELPSLGAINPYAPDFGLKLSAETGDGTTTAQLAITGTDSPILQAILSLLL